MIILINIIVLIILYSLNNSVTTLRTLQDIRESHRQRQKRYRKSKIARGFTMVCTWVKCDKETALLLTHILKSLKRDDIYDIAAAYGEGLLENDS